MSPSGMRAFGPYRAAGGAAGKEASTLERLPEPLKETRGRVLLDTDIGPDCDDAGALAVLFSLQKKTGFEIAGIVNCTSNPWGAGAVDAIRAFYGIPEFSIGEFRRRPFLPDHAKYNRALAERFSPAYRRGETFQDSAEVYRKALEESPDLGLTVVTIGQFNALADAMRLFPDLFRRKLGALISMAGEYPACRNEYNISCDAESAAYVFTHASCPVILSGHEIGYAFETGFPDGIERPDNPVWLAYRLWTDGGTVRWSWDLTTVYYAVMGPETWFGFSPPLFVDVAPDGSSASREDANGSARFLILRDGNGLRDRLNGILKEEA